MSMQRNRALMAALASAACTAAAAQTAYGGLCDASAAVGLGQHFIVADDESNLLRTYRRGTRMPVDAVDVTDHLGNRKAKGGSDEADIEGAARVGERIYWISSHARKGKDGSEDPRRQRFFATRIAATEPVPRLEAVGQVATTLLQDMLADPRFAMLVPAAQLGPESKGGMNIEGLAAMADGTLLIGFRNPQPEGKALLVPLRNPGPVIDEKARPLFGDPVRLDLGGRGIRSIERVEPGFLIAAGPSGPAKDSAVQPAFALYRWSGSSDAAPAFVSALGSGTERPEALFMDEQAHELVVLSDDGDEPVGKLECKDKKLPVERKSFRASTVAWPPAPR